MKLFDQTLSKLETALDLRLERHNLLASNLANANTPGFTPRDLDFAQAMSRAQNTLPEAPEAPGTMGEASALLEPGGVASPAVGLPGSSAGPASHLPTAGFDGNRVDADQAMVALAENAVQYGASAQAVNKKLAILLYAANDGT